MQELVDRAQRLMQMVGDGPAAYHEVLGGIHGVCASVERLTAAGCTRVDLQPALRELRDASAGSPLVQRMQQWPRGFPGDFETVDSLRSGRNQARPGTLGHAIESFLLASPIAQQRRNTVQWQAMAILTTLRQRRSRLPHGHPPRVLLMGCGSAPDLQLVAGLIGDTHPRIVLNDRDEGALEVALGRLRPAHLDPITVPGHVVEKLPLLQELGPYDLIVAGELFEYLPSRQAADLLRIVYSLLLQEWGRFVFTNTAPHQPYRSWLEHWTDWVVLERSEDDVRELCGRAGVPTDEVALSRDASNQALLVDLIRTW